MSICLTIKQKFNEARIRGEKQLIIEKNKTTKQQLLELEECGYVVREIKGRIVISE